ncbi:MAG: DMT family transporter [Bacteroidetes bacterium]|nr:DMT family transporter [Bacteroidota bacterium]
MNSTYKAHIALLSTTFIFGFAYNIVKSLMPVTLSPMQLIFIRLLGVMIIFWLFQRLFVPEKVDRKDLIMLAICGMFGFALNQTLFYEGLNLSTPVDASLIHVLNPILVMVFASLLLGEKVTWKKAVGIAMGASGVLILVLYGRTMSFKGNHAWGNLLIFLNMVFYSLYLVLIKPLVGKYHTTTILKWVSFFGFIFILPFSVKPALEINFAAITVTAWLGIIYIIVLNTFVAYLLINFALKHVSTTVVSYYSYLQPVIAAIMSVTIGQGGITVPKILAALLIFAGVYVVNRSPRPLTSLRERHTSPPGPFGSAQGPEGESVHEVS